MVEWKNLTTVAEVQYGYPFDSSLFSEDENNIPLIRIRDVKPGEPSTYFSGEYPSEYIIHKGDILVGMDGEFNLAKWKSRDGLLNQRVLKLTGKNNQCLNGYLFHYMGPVFKKIELQTAGGSVKHLSAKAINKIKIPIPSLDEQNRIVGILDTFTDSIENLKQQIAQRRKQYEHYRDQLLELEGKEGVEWKKLNTVCEVINGRAYKQQELLATGKYRVLRVGNFFSNDSWYFSDLELDDKYYCNEGDLLYAWSASFGPHIWTEEKTIYHYHIWKMNCSEELDKKFMFYWLQSENMRKQAFSHLHGATMAHLTKALMESLNVPLLPLSGQQRIVSILDTFEASISNLEAQLAQRQKQYEYYRNQLLTFE